MCYLWKDNWCKLGVIIFCFVRVFIKKKIIKLIFFKMKLVQIDLFWFCSVWFFRIKTDSNWFGLAFRFGLVFSCLNLFFWFGPAFWFGLFFYELTRFFPVWLGFFRFSSVWLGFYSVFFWFASIFFSFFFFSSGMV